MFWADFSTALSYVAHSQTVLFLCGFLAVSQGIERMHIQLGYPDKETRPSKGFLVLFMIANDVAGILAEEALDAFAELLTALDIYLFHARLARC